VRPGGGGGNDVRPRQGSLWENGGDSVTLGGGRGGGGGGGFSDAFGLFGDGDNDGDDTDESVYVSLTDVWVPTCLHYWIRASLVLDQPAEQTGGKHVSFVLFTRFQPCHSFEFGNPSCRCVTLSSLTLMRVACMQW
jgi:hypothetical protein